MSCGSNKRKLSIQLASCISHPELIPDIHVVSTRPPLIILQLPHISPQLPTTRYDAVLEDGSINRAGAYDGQVGVFACILCMACLGLPVFALYMGCVILWTTRLYSLVRHHPVVEVHAPHETSEWDLGSFINTFFDLLRILYRATFKQLTLAQSSQQNQFKQQPPTSSTMSNGLAFL